MRRIIIRALLAPVLAGFATASLADKVRPSLDDLHFLAGCWQSETAGRFSEECWTAPHGPLLLGTHRSVRGERAHFEFIRIQREDHGRIVYWASPGGKAPVPFVLVEIDGQRLVFENPQHDYPQRVVYSREGDTLTATTSLIDDGQSQRWQWRRQPCR